MKRHKNTLLDGWQFLVLAFVMLALAIRLWP